MADDTPQPERRPTGWRTVVGLLCGLAAAMCLAGAVFALACLVTWRGRGLCLAATAMAVGALVAVACRVSRRPRARRRWWVAAAAALAGLVALAAFIPFAPQGAGGEGTRVEHVFTRPETEFPRFALANIADEVDQIALGIALARWLDPHVDAPKAERIRRLTLPIYEAMGRDPDFADLGSVLNGAYGELWGKSPDTGHYVAMVPANPAATVVFLHGSGGNFASYWHVLSPLARDRGIAVVCPSFGFGNWHREGGVEAVLRATDHAVERYGLDPDRLYLAALSNGGRGATRVVKAHPRRFRGIVLLSAVLEHDTIREGLWTNAWRGLPVLFIHGAADLRLPLSYTRERIDEIRRGGAHVTEMVLDGEDHFLLFSQRDAVVERIAGWIEACPRAGGARH